jgi:hypothetical protein
VGECADIRISGGCGERNKRRVAEINGKVSAYALRCGRAAFLEWVGGDFSLTRVEKFAMLFMFLISIIIRNNKFLEISDTRKAPDGPYYSRINKFLY